MLNSLEKVVMHWLHQPTRLLNRYHDAMRRDEVEKASQIIEDAKSKYPARVEINVAYIETHLALGKLEQVKDTVQAVVYHPDVTLEQLTRMARILWQLDEDQQALNILETVASKATNSQTKRHACFSLRMAANIHLKQEKFAAALNSFARCACRGCILRWNRINRLLERCSIEEIAQCRDFMLTQPSPRKNSYSYDKLLSLLELWLTNHNLGNKGEAFTRIRRGCHSAFVHFVKSDVVDPRHEPLKPSFLILGAMKCGTSSLYDMMMQHPKCVPGVQKELHFFQFPFLEFDWYLEHFPRVPSDQGFVTGEATPSYYSYDVADRVKQLLPEVKMIFIRRDPSRRAISHIHHGGRQGLNNLGVTQALSRIDELQSELRSSAEQAEKIVLDITSGRRAHNNILALGCYEILMRRWRRTFHPDQFLNLELNELGTHPQSTLDQVFEFIGLDPIKINAVQSNKGNYAASDPRTLETLKRLEEFYAFIDELSTGG